MKNLSWLFLSFTLLYPFTGFCTTSNNDSIDKQFPNRKFYPGLNYISTEQLVKDVADNKYLVIDARPALGYNTLHIKGAENIHSGDKQFIEKFIERINKNNKPVVFYCGGLTCLKSYKASQMALEELSRRKIKREVYTYDSGISAFAYASPEHVLKNGKAISDDNPILDIKKLKQHARSPEHFIEIINNDSSNEHLILDVREKSQRILRKLFMFKREKKITVLEPEKLIAFLNKTRDSGKTLMVYGAVEKQIESVFQLIQMTGLKKWYYLEGGEYAYSQYMVNRHVNN